MITESLLVATTVAIGIGVLLWCLAAVVLALLTFRGTEWARISLVVSAGLAGALCLVGALLGSVPIMAPFAAAAVVVALLARPDARHWSAAATAQARARRGSMQA